MSIIVAEVEKAKSYSISVNFTSDVSHMDQLCLTIPYIMPKGDGRVNHTVNEIAEVVLNFLQKHNIPICDCRGQSCDNASNISAKYNGTQVQIKRCSEIAEIVPSMAHSLNLVRTCAAECCTAAVTMVRFNVCMYIWSS